MYQKIVLILFILNGDLICAASVADSWILFANAMRNSWNNCPAENGLWGCLKQSSLEVFDKMTKANVIPLLETVRFVRHQHHRRLSLDSDSKVNKESLVTSSRSLDLWSEYILQHIADLFKTHTLSIGKASDEGRRRRHNNMVPMMVLGATAFGVFAVPIGFQFLLVICGKAVLLSKMALLISSINGSSRVEDSGHTEVHYSVPAHKPYGQWFNSLNYWNREDDQQFSS